MYQYLIPKNPQVNVVFDVNSLIQYVVMLSMVQWMMMVGYVQHHLGIDIVDMDPLLKILIDAKNVNPIPG